MSVGIYCLSYNNPKRSEAIFQKFDKLRLSDRLTIYQGVGPSDVRMTNAGNQTRVWSVMYGHLDMIRQFYESNYTYGIMCEDDILIRSDFHDNLGHIIADFEMMKLDVLLLGYLINRSLANRNTNQQSIDSSFSYHDYPKDLWGTQMYMVSRTYAKYLLDTYTPEYAHDTLTNPAATPFSSDWTITKVGKKALVYPMFAIENNDDTTIEHYRNDYGQRKYHRDCYVQNYNASLFI
jgi:GR25 family glycosyltransferase involved in LPS biosynthesis